MIAKTVTGSDFEGALTYGAGIRKGRGKEPGEAPLLVVSNLLPGTAKQMAEQMQQVAEQSARIRKPVWHTVLSWKEGERVDGAKKVEAVKRYCELMGAPIDQHQVVVYEHKDKKHEHVHIYLNRVPLDGGPALRTDNNFYRQPTVCKKICQELGMQQLPARRQSIKDIDPTKQATRAAVQEAMNRLLTRKDRAGTEWLAGELVKENISIRYTHDKGGVLRGVSFERQGIAIKGQEAGFKAAQLREAFTTHTTVHQQRVEVPAGTMTVATLAKTDKQKARERNKKKKGPAL